MITEANIRDLETKGYTVVTGVISPSECDRYIEKYQQWLAHFGQRWPKSNKGLIRGYNTGHLEPTWEARLKVKDVFSQLWKTEKLLTSFDSIAIGRPPEEGEEPYDDVNSYWLHLDQESTREGLHAYQGGVYLEEALHDDWTLQVMENSHKVFAKFFKDNERAALTSAEKQFFRLNKTQINYFEKNGCKIVRVPVPKGGMVLWDSRLVHANAQPLKGRANPGRWRYVVFVSMTPAIWASQEDMRIKEDAYHGTKMTNHWSSEGSMLMQESAASKCHPKIMPKIAHTTAAQQLSGVIPYDFEDGSPNGPPKPYTHSVTVKRRLSEFEQYSK
ncbi:uncharacterized protein LOC127878136 isoform X2 [Dreissena polymorpha]|uniref:Phytanoyl-CoA dioxygenase n=2 Tax=Dreissena polymorpha TaxID=45954 RepID=A0A9D4HBV8_DREPO|nr:uncharacterized protein LOC127878136 isoform X2 [Dreissena polymorpha]XP_052280532.1 uncharacterized protein LOC127878136 isoform X2 [Dreissena polymorpha]KAH3830606.1 hypothetical protein DPMN_103851 [Dreissena polymorpha]